MTRYSCVFALVAAFVTLFAGLGAADLVQGQPAPDIRAVDIKGKEVNLDAIIQQQPYLVVLYFFSVNTGEDIARKLQYLDMHYGREKLGIIALGMKEDEAALKDFARRLSVQYHVINSETLKDADWLKEIYTLPLTLFVQADRERKIERVLVGGGAGEAAILKEVAENFFQQRKPEAIAVADQAIESGEEPGKAKELKGFILVAEGKLDEAEKEFGAIDSKTGLAKVALEKGDLETAAALADQAQGDGYAQAVKGEALLRAGKTDEAATALEAAAKLSASNWQRSEALNAQGRLNQQQGNPDAAINSYQAAMALDPYNVIALSNEGAAYREKGDLPKAKEVLEKAAALRDDGMVAIMLKQVQQELQEANDIKRHELIRAQIADLSKRFEEMKQAGTAKPADEWSTRPLIVAFLPSPTPSAVFFNRAGTDIVLQRGIESQLQAGGRVGVVERQMLDQLLQELNLGSSELAAADTQQRLGKVLSAGLIGFVDFAQAGPDIMMYLRMVDTETTAIAAQITERVDENNPRATIDQVSGALLSKITNSRELKGLIADAADENAVVINLGAKHGVEVGREFTVYEDGDAIEVGGRVIAHRQKSVGKLAVTEVEPDYAICKVTNKRDGAAFRKEMKIKAAP